MFLKIIFVILALIMSACTVTEVRMKQRSVGFMIASSFAVACNVLCFFLLGCEDARSANEVLDFFYLCYAGLYLGVFLTMCDLEGNKIFNKLRIPMVLITLCQMALIVSDLGGHRIFTIVQRMLLGSKWWVAKSTGYEQILLSFSIYRILLFISSVMIIYVMVRSSIHCPRIFRARYNILMVMQTLFIVVEMLMEMYDLPIWISCLGMTPVCVTVFYFFHFYCDNRFRDWALMSFANEMSDGFLLYDENEHLIHMNDRLKNTLPQELLDSFSDKDELDEWISKTTMINNTKILVYSSMSEKIYYKVKRTELGGLGTIYILHDTTETILKLQAMEQANTELERAAKMKSDFLANMSHEIRTPMNAVIGMTEIAMREKLPPHVLDYLSQIQNSGKNLLNIINDILDFSKIEAGKMEIIPGRYEPLAEINDIANVLMTRVGEKKLELFVTAETDIPHALEGDAMRIRQIIINLANNAIKFTKEGIVRICISCEQTAKEEVSLTYHVIDTGSGIKQEDLDKLFESFQQVDSKRNRSVEGTGLGLAISKRLCERMGGSMGVSSEYGKGSDFYFSIPQKVLEPEPDLVVEEAENKHAFCLNEDELMTGEFLAEAERLGVEGTVITSLEAYQATGGKDYLFFEENGYTQDMQEFLESHPECTGVILIDFDSVFEPLQPNLRVMRRPETTLSMVMILNDRELVQCAGEKKEAFTIDFVTPEAKILIVDDNAINITIAEGLLKPLQAQCFAAESGAEALRMVESDTYDIILMDHMMPEMDGVETTKHIREEIPSAADTPIIALTANAIEGVQEMFINEGMNDFVAKPIDIRILAEKIRQWLPEDKILSGEGEQYVTQLPEEEVEYEGLDSKQAIRALGSVELYQKVVEEYYRTGQGKLETIQTDYEQENWEDYTIKVHALKSSSRQIGAIGLGDMAEELEKAGKAMDLDTIRAKNGDTMQVYRTLLDSLADCFEKENREEEELAPIEPERLSEILQELTKACDNLDMDGMEAAKEELKKYAYEGELREAVNALYQAIDEIDIDVCMEIIAQIGM